MKHLQLEPASGFNVIAGTPRSQVATMVLEAGTSTGGPHNQHDRSDQWLYVISGRGSATVNDRQVTLSSGSLLLIEAGETHEIINTGDQPLQTFNIYSPPEY